MIPIGIIVARGSGAFIGGGVDELVYKYVKKYNPGTTDKMNSVISGLMLGAVGITAEQFLDGMVGEFLGGVGLAGLAIAGNELLKPYVWGTTK